MGYVATQTGKKMKKTTSKVSAGGPNGMKGITKPNKMSGSLKDVAKNIMVQPMPKSKRK